jgi:hypothetical protein
MKQNWLKYIFVFLMILLIIAIIKFFVVNRITAKDNNVKSNVMIQKNTDDILVNDSLIRVLLKNDSIIIEELKKHNKHGN